MVVADEDTEVVPVDVRVLDPVLVLDCVGVDDGVNVAVDVRVLICDDVTVELCVVMSQLMREPLACPLSAPLSSSAIREHSDLTLKKPPPPHSEVPKGP